jgi:hypothetical protein
MWVCVYMWVLSCVGVCMCGFCNIWVCVCMGFVMCGCVCVCVGGVCNVWVFCDICTLIYCVFILFCVRIFLICY